MKENYHKYISLLIIFLFVLAWFCFFQFWYPYHFFFQEQNQIFLWSPDYISTYFNRPGSVSNFLGDFLTQFYYYLYAGAVIQSLCQLCIGFLTYQGLVRLKCNWVIAMLFTLTVITFDAISHFNASARLSSTVSIMGWALLLWIISGARRKGLKITILFLALLPCYYMFGIPQIKKLQKPDFLLEKDFAVDCEYYFGNYDKVISLVEHSDQKTDQMLFFYNLIQAQRGQLPDKLMHFIPTDLGTFHKIGPETPLLIVRNMNELYWVLGDMTFTERAAMMTNVFSNNNRNVRMMRRLAECNIVSGDSLAAEKYLRILDKTLVYDKWAKNMRKHGKEIYSEKIKLVNRHDTITTSDNAHFLMMQLLDANPSNTVALDYILCSTLLLKDITNFKRDYDRYCIATARPRIKRLYQEALCIWLAGTNALQEDWMKYIQNSNVLKRFQQYNSQRGNPAFKGTYWYYFDKIKAPEI